MLDPAALFHLSDLVDPQSIARDPAVQPTLLVTLGSYGDAGKTQELIDDHLLEQFASHRVGEFDVDQLFDYTGHRPPIVFDRDHFREFDAPEITLHEVTDGHGTPFLLLRGPEPALQWERMTAAIEMVIDRFRVDQTVILQSFPAPAPHTRPVHVSAYASDRTLLGEREGLPASFQLGSSFTGLLTLRLGEHGKDVIGLVAHVPHYVADSEFPSAAIALLGQAEQVTGLDLPTEGRLEQSAAVTLHLISGQVAQSHEAQEVVARLEEQYEQFISNRELTSRAQVPTADEIGAEVEEFLKKLGPDDKPDDPNRTP